MDTPQATTRPTPRREPQAGLAHRIAPGESAHTQTRPGVSGASGILFGADVLPWSGLPRGAKMGLVNQTSPRAIGGGMQPHFRPSTESVTTSTVVELASWMARSNTAQSRQSRRAGSAAQPLNPSTTLHHLPGGRGDGRPGNMLTAQPGLSLSNFTSLRRVVSAPTGTKPRCAHRRREGVLVFRTSA
jgi:hypothetical protein